jgi:hypothetical protein
MAEGVADQTSWAVGNLVERGSRQTCRDDSRKQSRVGLPKRVLIPLRVPEVLKGDYKKFKENVCLMSTRTKSVLLFIPVFGLRCSVIGLSRIDGLWPVA